MLNDFAVLSVVRFPETQAVKSLVYDFAKGTARFLDGALQEHSRLVAGEPLPGWSNAHTFVLIQKAPSGQWGDVFVTEVRNLEAVVDEGLFLFSQGQPQGRLVNVSDQALFTSLPAGEANRRMKHIGGGRGARILHNGDGLIFKLVKDKPELRK